MAASQSTKTCIYCGGEALKVRKGEHIIPKAIGGRRTISDFCKGRTVCNPCNNGPLSELDDELCRRSPLSVIASQEIGSHIWQVWDVDNQADNLLLEARPDWCAQSLAQYPQIVFERSSP